MFSLVEIKTTYVHMVKSTYFVIFPVKQVQKQNEIHICTFFRLKYTEVGLCFSHI